ncbi:hypothetical protein Mpe_A2291 [Methylibium petroleiphilum PM1]|uniref:Uncharacterized protein n=1 Tax=Methylibium petroleiphilum (strain ATCC BAA-1232 / LMG 22953 / PM1) TaxID=420662 RepID=A2SI58_METPP|nr:hypothetical protein Mpe_A2291 [Methylibium petroleiphilum PM1]
MRSARIEAGALRAVHVVLDLIRGRRGASRACACACAVLMSACGGGTTGDTDEQPPAVRAELAGVVSPGFDLDAQIPEPGSSPITGRIVVSVKGSRGIIRTSDSFGAGPADEHRTSLAELDAPYMLRFSLVDGSFLVSVATEPGRANVTALTTLLVAQLLGADPATAFDNYSAASTANIARITDARIAEAQTAVTTYLQNVLGIPVRSGSASFTQVAFEAKDGDPMYDTMVALNAKLAADGITLTDLSQTIAAQARLCLTESITISLGGSTSRFCTASKSGLPETADPTVMAYVFTDPNGATLTLRVRGNDLLTERYVTAEGAAYDCSAAGCTGLVLGAPAGDLSRPATFTDARIGAATLNGSLTLPAPGPAIPVLPCDNNRYALVYPDFSFAAECVDASDPFGIGGMFGGDAGLPRTAVTFGSALSVYFEDGSLLSITALQPLTDPGTGQPVFFKCVGAECAGAVLGEPELNYDYGPELTLRSLTLAGVQLRALNADGTAAALGAATLQGTFLTIEYIQPPPTLNDCAGATDLVEGQLSFRADPVRICPNPVSGVKNTFVAPDGELTLNVTGSTPDGSGLPSPMLGVVVPAGGGGARISLVDAQQYACTGGCTGITVGAPNVAGERQVTFSGAVLREIESANLPGTRTITLNGSFVAPPP